MNKLAVSLAVLGMLEPAVGFALVIDSFEGVQEVRTIAAAPSRISTTCPSATAPVCPPPSYPGEYGIGTSRTVTVDKTAGPFNRGSEAIIGGGLLQLNNAVGAISTITVKWSGISGADSDFTAGGINRFFSFSWSDPLLHVVTVAFTVKSGTLTTTHSVAFPTGYKGDAFVPFASFSNPSLFASVSELTIAFSATIPSWDAGIDELEAVPAPGTALLLLAGLAGLGGRFRRR